MHDQHSSSGRRLFMLYACAITHEKGSCANGDHSVAFHSHLPGLGLQAPAHGHEGWHTVDSIDGLPQIVTGASIWSSSSRTNSSSTSNTLISTVKTCRKFVTGSGATNAGKPCRCQTGYSL